MNQKSLETVFLTAIFHQLGDKWQSKTLFLTMFDLPTSIVITFSIAAYSVCKNYFPFPSDFVGVGCEGAGRGVPGIRLLFPSQKHGLEIINSSETS